MALPPAGDADARDFGFVRGTLESVARLSAVVATLVYLSGFVVVAAHHARFGFVNVGFFRTRVITAGILVAVLTLTPAGLATAASAFFVSPTTGNLPRGGRRLVDWLNYWLWFYPNSLAFASFFVLLSNHLFLADPKRWWWIAVPSLFVGVAFSGGLILKRPLVRLAFTGFVVAGFVGGLLAMHDFGLFVLELSLWFYFCGVACLCRDWFGPLTPSLWPLAVVIAVSALWLFSITIYGEIGPQYGGGEAVSLLLYLSPDAPPIVGSSPAQVGLIEETDQGF